MLEKLEGLKTQLSELAAVLNEFKSEAVQLRILTFLLEGEPAPSEARKEAVPPVTQRTRTSPGQVEGQSNHKPKRGAAGTGAPATLVQLLSGDFFDRPRTINDLIEHCRHNLARTFKANEFSGKLARMVRKGQLTRKKNADKQYEYNKP